MFSAKVLSLFLGVSFGTVFVIVFLVTPFSNTAVTATKSSDRDRQSQNQMVSEIGTLEPSVHLPILRADPTPTATSPPPSILLNGGFEQGPLVWDQQHLGRDIWSAATRLRHHCHCLRLFGYYQACRLGQRFRLSDGAGDCVPQRHCAP